MAKPNKKNNQGGRVNYSKQNLQKEKVVSANANVAKAVVPSSKSVSLATNELNITLTAYDTLFFRESRPHDAVGASELSSLFPPPIRTLAGALRTLIGDQLDINWTTLKSSTQADFNFVAELGDAQGLGELCLNGPWINVDEQRLYPAPLYLMQKGNELKRLAPGSSVRCDLGTVRLPALPEGSQGFKNLEQHWITDDGMRRCLEGHVPTDKIYT
ncbi:MAG: type III-B CRISPR module-associated Cmr3 family protein, partial [Methylococcales bacterium]